MPAQWVTVEGGGKAGEEGAGLRFGSQVLATVRTC